MGAICFAIGLVVGVIFGFFIIAILSASDETKNNDIPDSSDD